MARYPREAVDAIRERTDLVEVVGRHVKLVRRGQSWVGLCPFHQEKTPSFNVIPGKGLFHCFGCQSSGDVFKFLQLVAGLSFAESVRELAGPAGVELEERELTDAERSALRARATLYDVLEESATWFESVLWTRPEGQLGRDYLRERGLGDETAHRARIGFAPPGWTHLLDHLGRKGFPPQLASDAGLVKARDHGGFYDTFRDRLVFPIRDERGRPVGFGGRILQGDGPKYINSPETRLYQKSSVLYGLDQARNAIQQRDRAIVVEGYFDVLSLHQAGFSEVIATCGTAVTHEHLERMRRLTRNVILLLDADEAGLRAAEKALPLFLAAEMLPWRLALPGAKDPDELVREHGPAALEEALKGKEPLLEWTLGRKLSAAGGGALARDKVMDEVAPWLARVPDAALHEAVARRLGVAEHALADRVARAAPVATPVENRPVPQISAWKPHRDVVHVLWLLVHRYDRVADLVAGTDPALFSEHGPVTPVIARLVAGEPVAAILPDLVDPSVARAIAAIVARRALYAEDEAARAMCEVLIRFHRPFRAARLAILTESATESLRGGQTERYRAFAAERAALLNEERALDAALLANDLAKCAVLLARRLDDPPGDP